MTSDTIFVHGLEIETIIGVYDRERNTKQVVLIDLEMAIPHSNAASSDDLRHTVDYATVSSRITSEVEATQYQLIEALAENVAALVLREFAVDEIRLKLSKPGAVKNASNVGIILHRSKSHA